MLLFSSNPQTFCLLSFKSELLGPIFWVPFSVPSEFLLVDPECHYFKFELPFRQQEGLHSVTPSGLFPPLSFCSHPNIWLLFCMFLEMQCLLPGMPPAYILGILCETWLSQVHHNVILPVLFNISKSLLGPCCIFVQRHHS